ncbi:MAG: UvrB/UvrC motif-containing protein, partial [Candidatus Omnitrophota bacterium]
IVDVAGQDEDQYELDTLIAELQQEMELSARNLQFERAAQLRDKIKELKNEKIQKAPRSHYVK